MSNGKVSMLDIWDNRVIVDGEMVEGHGEDSYAYCTNEEMVFSGVFDGCGGLGSKRYTAMDGHTGAYLASRIVSGVLLEWFNRCSADGLDEEKQSIKSCIQKCMLPYTIQSGGSGKFKGSMTKELPTTAVFSICRKVSKGIQIQYLWVGDSRGYLLTPKGLLQITEDDVEGEDALSNLSNDGVLTNVILAKNDYVIHEKRIEKRSSFIVVNATDGCFNYLPSPMHFEYILLDTLLKAGNIEEWKQGLLGEIRKVTGDDHTMTMEMFGYQCYEGLQEAYQERHAYLEKIYIQPWENATKEEQLALWEKYQEETKESLQ